MAFGIGSATKRAAKSAGKRIKESPAILLDPTTASAQVSAGQAAVEGGKQVVEAVVEGLEPEIPELPDAVAAPTPDDELIAANKRRAAQRKYAGAGRAGTMLTSNGDKLG